MTNNLVFRVDSSNDIATGHVMRCITLAKKVILNNKDTKILFICRNLDGNVSNRITNNNFSLKLLPPLQEYDEKILQNLSSSNSSTWLGVNWQTDAAETLQILNTLEGNTSIVIDHYGIDHRWEERISESVTKTIVIDDLANRKHLCDAIIDQNYYHDYENRYNDLISSKTQKFLGPNYAIIRDDFYKIGMRKRNNLKNIIIFFGGIDLENWTYKSITSVIKAQEQLDVKFNVTVIGANNNHQDNIKKLCIENNFSYHQYSEKMAEIMNWADLAIGAGGTTSWERCILGLPAILIAVADNQIDICKSLHNKNIVTYLGESSKVTTVLLAQAIAHSYENFSYETLETKPQITELLEFIS